MKKKMWLKIGVIVSIVLIFALIVLIPVRLIGKMNSRSDKSARVVREEVEAILKAVEEEDFEAFESYYASGVSNQVDLYDSFVELKLFLGEDIQLEKGQLTSWNYSSSGSNKTEEITMQWEIHSSTGKSVFLIERVFDSRLSDDGVRYIQARTASKGVFAGID